MSLRERARAFGERVGHKKPRLHRVRDHVRRKAGGIPSYLRGVPRRIGERAKYQAVAVAADVKQQFREGVTEGQNLAEQIRAVKAQEKEAHEQMKRDVRAQHEREKFRKRLREGHPIKRGLTKLGKFAGEQAAKQVRKQLKLKKAKAKKLKTKRKAKAKGRKDITIRISR